MNADFLRLRLLRFGFRNCGQQDFDSCGRGLFRRHGEFSRAGLDHPPRRQRGRQRDFLRLSRLVSHTQRNHQRGVSLQRNLRRLGMRKIHQPMGAPELGVETVRAAELHR